MPQKKYMVTGVKGFVGRYFINCLKAHEKDCKILGVDIAPAIGDEDYQYRQLNLTDKEQVYKVVSDFAPDYIVHLAAVSSVAQSWQDPASCFLNNMSVFLNLADAVRLNNIDCRILSVGSSEEYGYYGEPMREEFLLHPKSPYAVARVSQEYISKLYVDRFDLDIVMTRSFNHIGPRQSDKFVIPSFVKQLVQISRGGENKMSVGNIEVVRDFLDVRDVVEAYYKIIHFGKKREVYNVCSGQGTKLADIINTVSQKLGIKPQISIDASRIRANEIMSIIGNNEKLKNELGWQQNYSLEDTLADMVAYWSEQE